MTSQPLSVFFRHVTLFSALTAIKPDSTVSPVSIFWTNACIAFFPLFSGFKVAGNEVVWGDDKLPDCIVLQIAMLDPSSGPRGNDTVPSEKLVFVVQCRISQKDTPSEWESAEGQLLDHCLGHIRGITRTFAATAIGTKVRFWRYNKPELTPLFANDKTYHLLDGSDSCEVEQCLNYIRENGWNWVQYGTRRP
ncbi:hypothetical protein ASPTUDRAFT_50387 [Aspergillus tubingensis CBS 134.48]|uniref:Fungal-type protein kinase domain-containing protein n=1 Tax=Aspergillus tubingensis (strain CBS 134.48) TaxID=767770 RepID=A0A1L9NGU4_ASPTC|nr:hypothetical protein ASPTUDRAFT_50387 [Aspergillus tubingensis CBS 134.48]